MNRKTILGPLMTTLMTSPAICHAGGMDLSSAAFPAAAPMARTHAADGDCGGQNISPAITWSGLPAGSRSVAILLVDRDGDGALEVVHWIAYNITAERGELRDGEGQTDGIGITLGRNSSGATAYRGMCPPAGDKPHRYLLTLIATDLASTSLRAGLSRDELLSALKGHELQRRSIVGRFGR